MRGSACSAAVQCTAVTVLLVLSCEAASEPSTGDTLIEETGGTASPGSGGGTNSGGDPASGGAFTAGGGAGKTATNGGAGSGGSTASGGATGSGGSTTGSGGATDSGGAGAGGSAGGPPHEVGKCDSLPKPGTWEQITPPDVLKYLPPQGKGSPDGNLPFGVQAIGLDPTVDGTVYLGTCKMGLWKSTDCGATWARINTGKNGATLDLGAQNSMVIDPMNPKIIYTNSFYGQNGAFKSTDGGVNWEQFWPPTDPALSKVVAYNFVGTINMDPSDHQHIVLSFHAACSAPYSNACFAETKDAGGSWRFINGNPSWVGGEGTSIYFLDNGRTFLFGSQSNGLARSIDGGATWQAIQGIQVSHGGGQMVRTKDGRFYLGTAGGILRSDTTGVSWSLIPNTNRGIPTEGLVSDGTNLYAAVGYPWSPGDGPAAYLPYYTATEADGLTWKQMPSPKLVNGGYLAIDHGHRILYSTNLYAGFYRVVIQ